MKKKRIGYKIVLFWVCLIFTFLSLTSIVIFAASGYHMNWTNLSMEKTGLIWLRGEEKNIEILLNGKKKGKKIPIRLTNLFPGWYEITIKKEGYFTWRKSLNVEANQAYEVRNVMLFKKDQKPIAVNDQEEEKLIEKANVAVEVTTNKGEIYYGERLVTRFMDDPSFYVVYNDRGHLIFQLNNEIHLIDLDGTNDNVLTKINSKEEFVPALRLVEGGRYLLYRDGNQIKKLQLR